MPQILYKKWLALVIGLSFVGLFAGALVLSTSLPKDSDDEVIYTGLAAKIRAVGLSEYNLRHVSIDPAGKYWKLRYQETGNFLGIMSKGNVDYYNVPFYFNPPLFPIVLVFSHEVFNRDFAFLLVKRDQEPSFQFAQFYAAFPNILFALLFLSGVFFLGKTLFSEKAGLLAVLFCLTSPVLLAVTFKVWSDLMAATLIVWSFYLWHKRTKTRNLILSGILFGLAVLVRTSALFALPIFFTKQWKSLLIWVAIVFLCTSPWFYPLLHHYGTIFYFPEAAQARESLSWLKYISRPWYFYLLQLFYLSPVFVFAVPSVKKNPRLGIWIISFLLPLSLLLYTSKPIGVEDRYLLPCYPALALLSAKTVLKLSSSWSRRLLAVIILAICVWSVRIGAALVISRESLRFVPW